MSFDWLKANVSIIVWKHAWKLDSRRSGNKLFIKIDVTRWRMFPVSFKKLYTNSIVIVMTDCYINVNMD